MGPVSYTHLAVVGAGHRAAAAAVVDQGVHSLLQHTLLVADDDVGGTHGIIMGIIGLILGYTMLIILGSNKLL